MGFENQSGIQPQVKAVFTALSNIAVVSTADGSDAATTQALANANKAKINEILNAVKALG